MVGVDHGQLVGRVIAGKFVIEDLLGSGAMGAVFRARQVALDKVVAIKVLHSQHATDAQFVARFQREARAASRLNHPNSLQVLDFGAEPDGLLYIAMEYLDGRSLHRVLRDEWPLPPKRIADLLMQTLAALAVAHDMGIVHRDLKPENVMVLRGTDDDGKPKDIVKVCDFGIAKITDPRAYRANGLSDSDAPVTTAGYLVGTPEYMSPEQGRGEKLDPRSDLYSVGVILFEMLTQRVPFDAENAIGIVLKHITEEPPPPSRVVNGIDPRLEAIALRALKKFREDRHAHARDMRAELRVVAEGPEAEVMPPRLAPPGTGRLSEPPSVTAPTVALQAVPLPTAAVSGGVDKPTLEGTIAIVATPQSRRRGVILASVTVGALAIGALGTGALVRTLLHRHATDVGLVVAPTGRAEPVTIAPLSKDQTRSATSTAAGARTEPFEGPSPVARAATPAIPHSQFAKAATLPAALVKPAVSASAAPAPAASASAAPSAVATQAASVAPQPVPSAALASPPAASSVAAAPAPAPTPADVPDSTFDPNRAYVEVGMINAQGVTERAVRGALHGVGLSQCYKALLVSHGSRATGIATLNLSFDEGGLARSAIVTGGDFLPGLAGCIQRAATGVQVPPSQIEPGGGIAEVTLDFREP